MPQLRSRRKKRNSSKQNNKLDGYLTSHDSRSGAGEQEQTNKMAEGNSAPIESQINIKIEAVQATLTQALEDLKSTISTQIASDDVVAGKAKLNNFIMETEKSLEFNHGIVQQNVTLIKKLESENQDLKAEIQRLDKMYLEQNKLITEVKRKLGVKVLNLERYSRDFNLRFDGIEESTNENCREVIAQKIKEYILYPGNECEILELVENARRTGSKVESKASNQKKCRQLIAKCYSRPIRREIAKAARVSVNKDRNNPFSIYEDMPKEDYQLKRRAHRNISSKLIKMVKRLDSGKEICGLTVNW